jgi:hypothetical protein
LQENGKRGRDHSIEREEAAAREAVDALEKQLQDAK